MIVWVAAQMPVGSSSTEREKGTIALARQGYDLVLTELDVTQLKETLAHPDIARRKAVPVPLDLRSRHLRLGSDQEGQRRRGQPGAPDASGFHRRHMPTPSDARRFRGRTDAAKPPGW